MKNANDIGNEIARLIGNPDQGPSDEVFLTHFSQRVTRHRRHRRLVVGMAVVLIVAGATTSWLLGTETLEEKPLKSLAPTLALEIPATHSTILHDPVASMLLESARLRMDGFGDPTAAIPHLRLVIDTFPDSKSAIEATRILKQLGGKPCTPESA